MERNKLICVLILFAINLLNYMDRFTIAGVLNDVINFYEIDDKQAGFLQTVFIIFFMLFAPFCGFLGDRYNRKRIILIGEIVWVSAVLASSFIPKQHFVSFVLLRGIVGIGEASYAVCAPTVIADLFAGKTRSRVLMFFYFAIPVGSGLGYVVGSSVTNIAKAGRNECNDCWQWGVRATPLIGLFTIIGLIFGVDEPSRGQAENIDATNRDDQIRPVNESADEHLQHISAQQNNGDARTDDALAPFKQKMRNASDDLLYLAKNYTFVWSTIAYTAVVFSTGTLTWWAPAAIEEALAAHHNSTDSLLTNKDQVSLAFGVITCLGGIIGVALGTVVSLAWKRGIWLFEGHSTPCADPLVSAIGSFAATPFLFLAIKLVAFDAVFFAWIILFFTIVCLCLNWAINVDMLMSIIVPQRRSIASAVQILISHAFGDASGPWIIGAISDWVRGDDKTPEVHFHSLVVALYLPNALLVASGIAFLLAAYALPNDLKRIEEWRLARGAPNALVHHQPELENGHVSQNEYGALSQQQQLQSSRLNGVNNEAFDSH